MPPKPHKHAEAAEALVAVTPQLGRWIERLLAQHEPPLTVAQLLALRAVAGGEQSAGELAQRTGVSGPAVSQLLTALAAAGLVERRELEADRRRQALLLSATGRRALASANALLRRQVGALIADLPGPEADALARALPQVEAALAGKPPPRRPSPPPRHPPHRP